MENPCLLYISSSIGLGHVSKDLAIASELKRIRPDIEILWLAGHPASDVLCESGQRVLPEAEKWIGASKIAEKCTHDGKLNLVRYVYRSMPAWTRNACLVSRVIRRYKTDLVIGNEAYEIDIPMVFGLLRLPVPFIMIFDFVGTDPTTGNIFDHIGSSMLNAAWACDNHVYGRGKHSALFIGELNDIPETKFAWRHHDRRQYASKYYNIIGHVIRFNPRDYENRTEWRRRLGFGDRPLIVCSAGGTSIGQGLLELCGQSLIPLRKFLPDVHMVIVLGPRITKESVQVPSEVELVGHYPRLYELFACCDVAVVQCGASSTTELSALRTPFIYFPVEGHFEQELVARRLARYNVGKRLSLKTATPETLAEAIHNLYMNPVTGGHMPVDGASKAASHIVKVLEEHYPRK